MNDLRLSSANVADLTVVPDLQVIERPAATVRGMALLAAGVPLSLLFDLADPAGPPSADMLSSEAGSSSVIGDLLAFRAGAAERSARSARAPRSQHG